MVIVASSPFVRLIEGKETVDFQKRHVEHVGSQDVVTVRWINDTFDGNVESNGGMENEVDGYIERAHLATPSPLTVIATAAL